MRRRQATEVGETLAVLDAASVAGVFVFTFIAPLFGHSAEPRYDLDMVSASLVRTYADGRRGQRYPGLPWEPKRAFEAVADYYGKGDAAGGTAGFASRLNGLYLANTNPAISAASTCMAGMAWE